MKSGSIDSLVGRRAPDFRIPCTRSAEHPACVARLGDYADRWLLLMFYPQDFSLICPTELTTLSRRYDELAAHRADVLAVSIDSVESHERWIDTDQGRGGLGSVRFPLGSDADGAVSRAYGMFAESQGLALRGLFIVDPNSVVQYSVVHNMSTGRSVDEIFRVLGRRGARTPIARQPIVRNRWTRVASAMGRART